VPVDSRFPITPFPLPPAFFHILTIMRRLRLSQRVKRAFLPQVFTALTPLDRTPLLLFSISTRDPCSTSLLPFRESPLPVYRHQLTTDLAFFLAPFEILFFSTPTESPLIECVPLMTPQVRTFPPPRLDFFNHGDSDKLYDAASKDLSSRISFVARFISFFSSIPSFSPLLSFPIFSFRCQRQPSLGRFPLSNDLSPVILVAPVPPPQRSL